MTCFSSSRITKLLLSAAVIGGLVSMNACSSDKTSSGRADAGSGGSGGSSATCAAPGGPEPGTAPDHCTTDGGIAIKQATGACSADSDSGIPPTVLADGGPVSDYGATMVGTEGDDDDCKYHVVFTVTPVCEKEGVTFTVTVTSKVTGQPVTGAYPYLEASIGAGSTLHDAPISVPLQTYKEEAGGVYVVGPVVFDEPGTWTARFHFFENCSDDPVDSPHGHAAFYIQVP
jgi:YtkA-like